MSSDGLNMQIHRVIADLYAQGRTDQADATALDMAAIVLRRRGHRGFVSATIAATLEKVAEKIYPKARR